MKNNKRADSIAWIIIAVFILSFALMGIINVLDYNKDVTLNYEKETWEYILKSNAQNILKNIDISWIEQNEIFYINKNNTTKEYEVLTWATNEVYKYIDINWDNVDPSVAVWKTFERYFQKKIDILRHDIKPPEIDNLVFHFDANNIDGDNNSTISDWDTVSVWKNLANNWVPDAVDKSTLPIGMRYSSSLPKYKENWILNLPMVEFNWIDQQLWMDVSTEVNWNYFNCSLPRIEFTEKSFAIVFKTWFNIEDTQMIYEQWWRTTWYNFSIEWWDVWAWIHNKAWASNCQDSSEFKRWDTWHQFKSVNLWEVLPNTTYFVMVVQDSSNFDIAWNPIDSQNRLKIYLNGFLVSETDHVDPQQEHIYWGIWNIYYSNVSWKTGYTFDDYNSNDTAYFEWGIWELISRNHALTENEVRWVQNYFSEKWLWWTSSIRYDVVNTYINEYKQY